MSGDLALESIFLTALRVLEGAQVLWAAPGTKSNSTPVHSSPADGLYRNVAFYSSKNVCGGNQDSAERFKDSVCLVANKTSPDVVQKNTLTPEDGELTEK